MKYLFGLLLLIGTVSQAQTITGFSSGSSAETKTD